VVNDRIYFSML
jgi:MFS transporter, OCT family, solute carrier family 22 (organic cation transporter), member 4/5